MATWAWDESAKRYRDQGTGRFMSGSRVDDLVARAMLPGTDRIDYLSEIVSDGLISPRDWERMMREEIKRVHIREYLLGIGGRDRMTQADWGRTGGVIGDQYRYLRQFRNELAGLSEAQIRARSHMYLSAAREAFERANAQVHADAAEVRWHMNPAKENCEDCRAFASLGWQPKADDPFGGCYPASGCTKCLSRCGCEIQYRTPEE